MRMKFRRRQFLRLAAAAAACPLASLSGAAQAYPTRPLRLVVGFPPGGGSDLVARLMGMWLSERLGHQVVIENKPGGNTNVAAQAVLNSSPDGHTLLWVGISNALNAVLYRTPPFNLVQDLAPVAGLVVYPLVIETRPSAQCSTIAELISLARARPGSINMASYGTGSVSHVAGELLKAMTGIDVVHVPYRGAAPMLNDLLGGQVQVAIDTVAASLPHIRSGSLQALAVTTASRIQALPDVPTIAEAVPGYHAVAWTGIAVPRATPAAIVATLNREINAALADPDIAARLSALTTMPLLFSPAEFGLYIAAEIEKWGTIVRAANIKVE
jgi:tripartite-type tricarboxylate transporter receptor subunit TctC